MSKWLRLLKNNGVPESRLSVKYFLRHLLRRKVDKGILAQMTIAEMEGKLDKQQKDALECMCLLRMRRMPVQYILGEWDFRGVSYTLRPPVLIPRPETEDLIEAISQDVGSGCSHNFVDVGCGSGCTSIALLRENPGFTGTAIDLSEEACCLTMENAARCGVDHRLKVVCESVQKFSSFPMKKHTLLVSNPPYISTSDVENLEPEIRCYEDPSALDGGNDGLSVTTEILNCAKRMLVPNSSCWLELGLGQWQCIRSLIEANRDWDLSFIKAHQDFTGRLRFVHLKHFPH